MYLIIYWTSLLIIKKKKDGENYLHTFLYTHIVYLLMLNYADF